MYSIEVEDSSKSISTMSWRVSVVWVNDAPTWHTPTSIKVKKRMAATNLGIAFYDPDIDEISGSRIYVALAVRFGRLRIDDHLTAPLRIAAAAQYNTTRIVAHFEGFAQQIHLLGAPTFVNSALATLVYEDATDNERTDDRIEFLRMIWATRGPVQVRG